MSMHPSNRDRATWAGIALEAYREEARVDDLREAVHDLICDLGHYCDQHHLGFRKILRQAIASWVYEQSEPAGIDRPVAVHISISRRAA